jgi:hypothetical protein
LGAGGLVRPTHADVFFWEFRDEMLIFFDQEGQESCMFEHAPSDKAAKGIRTKGGSVELYNLCK